MLLKSSNNFIRFLIVPLAVCAMMFNARCKDDSNDELTQQTLLSLLSCKGGTMIVSIDVAPAETWKCCRAINRGTYWEIVGSQGSEIIRLYFGKLTPLPQTYTGSTNTSKVSGYIDYITGGTTFSGVTENASGASSSITIDTDDTSITGSFIGEVFNDTGLIDHNISGTFEALK